MLQILKIIFIFFLVILSLSKIEKEINEKDIAIKNKIINIIEIIVSIALVFFIYKI